MARYKHTEAENGQGMFLTVNLKEQLLPGTFEYMLDEIINTKIDTGIFDKKYKNDQAGARAIPPKALLKLVIYGYSKGKKSSRGIWELSRNNIVAKALINDISIHWTTIADFISENSEEFKRIFIQVLTYCNELGLVGGETFAIDGLRLPANASMAFSGNKEQLEKRLKTYQRMAEKHLIRHKRKDENGETDENTEKHFVERQKKLKQQIEKLSVFINTMEKKEGRRGQEIQSNVTDNESAVILGPSGYIQGYIGLAVSDQKNQIIVSAKAVGSANEGEHFTGMLDQTGENIKKTSSPETWEEKEKTFLADRNYFSEDNLKACDERGIDVIIPDSQYKRRLGANKEKLYELEDFIYFKNDDYYKCPQGKKLPYKGADIMNNDEVKYYRASLTDCRACPVYNKCIRTKKERNMLDKGKNLVVRKSNEHGSFCKIMRKKLDTEEYQEKYARRIQIIEPVFANISYCKGLDRFTLRGKEKVNGQWQLYCIMHNLGKCLNEHNIRMNSA